MRLHNLRGGIVGEIPKNLYGDDVRLLASNLHLTQNSQWQAIFKCRKSSPGFKKEFALFLGIFDAFQAEPFFIELTKEQFEDKLKSWGISPVEALKNFDEESE